MFVLIPISTKFRFRIYGSLCVNVFEFRSDSFYREFLLMPELQQLYCTESCICQDICVSCTAHNNDKRNTVENRNILQYKYGILFCSAVYSHMNLILKYN
jgi:hypothetical protein